MSKVLSFKFYVIEVGSGSQDLALAAKDSPESQSTLRLNGQG